MLLAFAARKAPIGTIHLGTSGISVEGQDNGEEGSIGVACRYSRVTVDKQR